MASTIWSLATKSYMEVTCHYVNNKWELVSRVLSLKHLTDYHNPDYFYDILYNILVEWTILEMVIASVSDSGANIFCALNSVYQIIRVLQAKPLYA